MTIVVGEGTMYAGDKVADKLNLSGGGRLASVRCAGQDNGVRKENNEELSR
jgi:hypothetical protein